MAVAENWDEAVPASGSNLALGDDAIRSLKVALRERLRNAGMSWDTPGPSAVASDGRLTCGVQGTTGVLNLAHDGDGTPGIVVSDGDGVAAPDTVSFAGKTLTDAVNVDSGENPGHAHDVTVPVILSVSGAGRVTGIAYMNKGNGTMELIGVTPLAFVAPSGGSIVFQMHRIDLSAPGTTPASGGSEVFLDSASARPEITTGNFTGTEVQTFGGGAGATLPVNSAWTFEIDTYTAPASDFVLMLRLRRV